MVDQGEPQTDDCALEQNEGIVALGFRDELRAAFAVKARDGECCALGIFDDNAFVLSRGLTWPDTKSVLQKQAFLTPMTRAELDFFGVFRTNSVDELLEVFRAKVAHRKNLARPAVFRG
jgi:hypothetical protein